LDRSPWVTGPETRLIKIVLHGLQGAMEIQGKSYDLEMPGFGQILPDTEIASLLTFVRRQFGGPRDPISPAVVRRVREAYANRTAYWKVDELLAEP
jgi:mono/diheme cytochrome c family protein